MPVCGKSIASQELQAEPGVFPAEVGTMCPEVAEAQIHRQDRPTCGGIEIYFEWRRIVPHVHL